MLHFIPRENLTIKNGEENLTEYRFNKKQIAHQFCKTCGVQAFAYGEDGDGNKTAAINIRCLENINLDSLTVTPFNGKDY